MHSINEALFENNTEFVFFYFSFKATFDYKQYITAFLFAKLGSSWPVPVKSNLN